MIAMGHGGARNRSGPEPDLGSARSERRGFTLQSLPAAGFDGDVPEFPLLDPSLREVQVWREAWRSPQAWAWSQLGEAWRVRTVALWVRTSVRCEAPDASPAVLAQLHRLADQVGMTTAGLREMGWKVGPVAAPQQSEEQEPAASAAPPARRLRVAGGDA